MDHKIDYKITLKSYYNPNIKSFHFLELPAMQFLAIDGKGDPNVDSSYQQAVEALYGMSYGIKFELKSQGFDYVVPPLEGLWWMNDMNEFTRANKSEWLWTMMIMQPERVTKEVVDKVRMKVAKKQDNPAIQKIRLETIHEGLAVQTMYVGAYDDEAPVIADMHRFISENGFHLVGKHHEIYLGDPRKTPPGKLKTILRQPVQNN